MSRRVWATPQAEAQARAAQGWWRENREASPDLFREELAGAVGLLAAAPEIGRPYPEGEVPGLRRLLLPSGDSGRVECGTRFPGQPLLRPELGVRGQYSPNAGKTY